MAKKLFDVISDGIFTIGKIFFDTYEKEFKYKS